MKKFWKTLLVGLMLCAMFVPAMTVAAEETVDREDGIGLWAVYDGDGEYLSAVNAMVLGNDSKAYVLALSDFNDGDGYFYRFISPENDAAYYASIEDQDGFTFSGQSMDVGLYSVDDSEGTIYRTGLYPNSDDYIGDAYLLYIDMDAVDYAESFEDCLYYRHIVDVEVADNVDGVMYLNGVPSDAAVGAAILSEDYLFLGFYAGENQNGDYAFNAQTVVQMFPTLASFYEQPENPTPTRESATERATEPASRPGTSEKTTAASGKTTDKKKSDDKDDEGLSQTTVILLAALAVLLIGGGAAFLIVRGKKSGSDDGTANYYPQGGNGTDIPLQNAGYPTAQPEQTDFPLPQAPDAYNDMNVPQPPAVGMDDEMSQPTLQMEQMPAGPVPAAPDAGQAQVFAAPGNYSFGETVPVAPVAPVVPDAPVAPIAPDAGKAQVFTAPENYSIGETLPVAPGAGQAQADPYPIGGTVPLEPMQPPICIVGKGGHFAGQSIREQGEIVIGRQKGRCTLCYPVDEKGISSVHCSLRRNGGQLELTDNGSTYGTFLNGAKLTPNVPVVLRSGDIFYLADPINSFTVTD